jgi:hypothetical protein
MIAQGRKRTGAGRWNAATALVAVAVLLVHALVMGWHVPPSLRLLAGLDSGLCQAPGSGRTSPDQPAPDQPAAPGDHLQHCPICLLIADGTLGPVAGPQLAPPISVASAAPIPVRAVLRADRSARPFAARAPPIPV